MFKLSRTFKNPAQGSNAQRGFPSPGAGNQTTGQYTPPPEQTLRTPEYPTKGTRSFFRPSSPEAGQRGFPTPQGPGQGRPRGSMPNTAPISGLPVEVYTPYFSRGADAYVQNYGKVLTNPIGAGVVAQHRTQASYGPAGQYINGAIWWTTQVTPTSINMQGLNSPEVMQAILGQTLVQAVVRVA